MKRDVYKKLEGDLVSEVTQQKEHPYPCDQKVRVYGGHLHLVL